MWPTIELAISAVFTFVMFWSMGGGAIRNALHLSDRLARDTFEAGL